MISLRDGTEVWLNPTFNFQGFLYVFCLPPFKRIVTYDSFPPWRISSTFKRQSRKTSQQAFLIYFHLASIFYLSLFYRIAGENKVSHTCSHPDEPRILSSKFKIYPAVPISYVYVSEECFFFSRFIKSHSQSLQFQSQAYRKVKMTSHTLSEAGASGIRKGSLV